MLAPHISVVNLGCRVNRVESDRITADLMRLGFAIVEPQDADLIVINTCAVTGEAEAKTRKAVRHALAHPNEPYVIVTGCVVNLHPEELLELSDRVIAEPSKIDVAERVCEVLGVESDSVPACSDGEVVDALGRSRLGVKIQDGCNHRCTYCIVPYARGNNRSVKEEDIISQIRELLGRGFGEICLTGVDACSYRPSFSGLIQHILEQIPELPSLQFGSLDPAAVDDDFIALVGRYRNVHPHFHLSVQSGDNMILKRMRRRHTREDVIKLCGAIRRVRPEATFGADFICGFPTESDENFQNTLKLVTEAGITRLHVFPYSERPGTPAALMPQLPVEIRRERARILREQGETDND